MSGVAVIAYLLANDAGVLAAVSEARIFAGPAPKGTATPNLEVFQISGTETTTVAMTEAGALRTERVQVTHNAASYPQLKQLMALSRTACRGRRGILHGIDVDSILPAGEGPDGYESAPEIHSQTRDFFVKWRG